MDRGEPEEKIFYSILEVVKTDSINSDQADLIGLLAREEYCEDLRLWN
jgi:hypothetical protein